MLTTHFGWLIIFLTYFKIQFIVNEMSRCIFLLNLIQNSHIFIQGGNAFWYVAQKVSPILFRSQWVHWNLCNKIKSICIINGSWNPLWRRKQFLSVCAILLWLHIMTSWWHGNVCALLALCKGNPPATSGFLHKGSLVWSFDIFFVVILKQVVESRVELLVICFIFDLPWCLCDYTVMR